MPALNRYPASNALSNFIDSADPIYGTGVDGNVTLDGSSTVLGMIPVTSVYSMTQDLYFNNLTIDQGVSLAPNGYRIFVKNLLALNNNSVIGFSTGYATSGSIAQGGAINTAVTHSLRRSFINTDGYCSNSGIRKF